MLLVALSFLAASQYVDYCNEDIGRMTVVIEGREARSFVVRNDKPNEVTSQSEWVESGGVWRRTNTPENYRETAPTFRIEGDTLIFEYSVGDKRYSEVWHICR